MAAAIEVRDLQKHYKATWALKGVSLEVPAGSFFGLFGPNGAGKTTLLRLLTGQIEPTAGSAAVLGIDPAKEPLRVKAAVGIVPEVESPPSYLTAHEYLYFVGTVRHLPDTEDRIRRWLAFFDLEESSGSLCKDLSKGMRQKLMLAAAFLHEPPLLFLDEPFINLDPTYQRKARDYLVSYVKSGGTVFMASHLLDLAEKVVDHGAIINGGRILAQGRMPALLAGAPTLEDFFLRTVERHR